jgi:transposase
MLQSSGLSERAISKTIGIHRDTVKKYMALSEEDISKIKRDMDRSKKLDQHRGIMIFYVTNQK